MSDWLTYLTNWWICSFLCIEVSKSNTAWGCIRRGARKCIITGLPPLNIELLRYILHYDSRFDNTSRPDLDLDRDPTCGRRFLDVRPIIGGDNATEKAWPWQVMILSKGENSSMVCGGTLIDKYWVLTAAHCLTAEEIIVVAGVTRLNFIKEENIFASSKVIPHEHFARVSKTLGPLNDIGLVKLKSPVTFSSSLVPACLPTSGEGSFESLHDCYITGFGNKDPTRLNKHPSVAIHLQELRVDVLSQSECQNRMPFSFGENFVKDSYICVKHNFNRTASACRGDSGGPLSCLANGIYYIVGVASYGDSFCLQIFPNVYTRVSEFTDWILQQMEIHA